MFQIGFGIQGITDYVVCNIYISYQVLLVRVAVKKAICPLIYTGHYRALGLVPYVKRLQELLMGMSGVAPILSILVWDDNMAGAGHSYI